MVSSYTTGQIGFLLCEKNPLVAATMDEVTKRWETIQQIRGGTTYYQAKLQQSAFDLPLWVENAVYGVRGVAHWGHAGGLACGPGLPDGGR